MNIPVVLGSIREGRKSIAPARYVQSRLQAAGHESVLVDFKELPLPLYAEAKEPGEFERQYPNENAKVWSTIADAADAFVVVSPEYNHGMPAVLKNAFDWLYPEFEFKAVGLVGVSNGRVAGARVIEQLRLLSGNFSMFDVRETVMFASVQDVFDAAGKLLEPRFEKSVDGLIASVSKAAAALKAAR